MEEADDDSYITNQEPEDAESRLRKLREAKRKYGPKIDYGDEDDSDWENKEK